MITIPSGKNELPLKKNSGHVNAFKYSDHAAHQAKRSIQ
jgi:hypothetical protein